MLRGGGKFPSPWGKGSEILLEGESFLLGGGNLRRSDLDHSNFLKLRTAFCEYWISIKVKISMTCVRKEYEIKTNGTGAMTTAKKDFFKGYNMKIVI